MLVENVPKYGALCQQKDNRKWHTDFAASILLDCKNSFVTLATVGIENEVQVDRNEHKEFTTGDFVRKHSN